MEIINKTEDRNVYEWKVRIDSDTLSKIRNMGYLKNRWLFFNDPTQAPAKNEVMAPSLFDQEGVRLLESRLADFLAEQEDYPEDLLGRPSVVKVGAEDETGGLTVTLKGFGKADVELAGAPSEQELRELNQVFVESLERVDNYVEAEIESQRYKNVRLTPKEGPATNQDYVNLEFEIWSLDNDGNPDIQVMEDNLNLSLNPLLEHTNVENAVLNVLGSEILNKSAGESVESVVPTANGPMKYSAIINDVYEAEIPDANDDFAVEVSEYDTMDEYREGLREAEISRLVDLYNSRRIIAEVAATFTDSKVDYPDQYGDDRKRYIKNLMEAMEAYSEGGEDEMSAIKPYRFANKDFRLEGFIFGSLLIAEKILQENGAGDVPENTMDLLTPQTKEVLRDIFRYLHQKRGSYITPEASQFILTLYGILIGEFLDYDTLSKIFEAKVEKIDREKAFEMLEEVKQERQRAQEEADEQAELGDEDVDELEEEFFGDENEDLEDGFFDEEDEEDLEEAFFGSDEDEDEFFDVDDDLEEEFFDDDDDLEDDFFDDEDDDEFLDSDDDEASFFGPDDE